MNRHRLTALVGLLGICLLPGCANRYVIRLNNGNEITTRSRPRLDEKAHVFRYKDANGVPSAIQQLKVAEISPL